MSEKPGLIWPSTTQYYRWWSKPLPRYYAERWRVVRAVRKARRLEKAIVEALGHLSCGEQYWHSDAIRVLTRALEANDNLGENAMKEMRS